MNLKDKLNRFNSQITQTQNKNAVSPKLSSRYQKLADALGGELVSNFAGTYCLVKRLYPFNHQHGNQILKKKKVTIPVDAFTVRTSDISVPIEKLLFFDIETTGLGGSGAVAFLVGFASITDLGFEIRQYMLVDYTDETAMLEDILKEISDEKTIVSYNGATFDLPFMQERMILKRVAKEFKTDIHIDLLHATRRFYKRRLQNCKLTNIEERMFSFYREEDIPGYLVPSVYFEWLNSEELGMMDDVLEHNRLDILSLYFILLEIFEMYQSKGKSVQEIDDLHSLSKMFHRKKNYTISQAVNEQIHSIATEEISTDILFFQAMQFKKIQQFEHAVSIWNQIIEQNCKESLYCHIELAKYYEHKVKDYQMALEYASQAQQFNQTSERIQIELVKRINRLSSKIQSK